MDRSAPSWPSRLTAALRWAAPLVLLVLAVTALAQVRDWQTNRDALLGHLGDAGVEAEEVIAEVRREGTPHHARLATARALVFDLLAAPPLSSLAPEDRDAETVDRLAQLRTARGLAVDGMRAQPNSWQAAMLLGATTYMRWSLERDPRLFTEADAWQQPLLNAMRDAPSQGEPRRLLATAYLELWPALSAEKKRFAQDLLTRTFAEDGKAFQRLGPIWMATAPDLDTAFAVVPQTPAAWQLLTRGFAERQQWHRFCRARARQLDAIESTLEDRLADGMARSGLGDDFHSRTRFARVVADAPRTMRFSPLVNQALSLYPPGLQAAGTGTALRDWLQWALEMDRVWVAPLTTDNVARLATLADRLLPHDAALAALLGGDLALAERLERLERTIRVAPWAPYLMAKARRFLDRDLLVDARTTLERVDHRSRRDPVYQLLRLRLAQGEGDQAAVEAIEATLDTMRARRWAPGDWWRGTHESRLAILAAEDTTAVVIEVASGPAEGSVAEIQWDGTVVQTLPVYPGSVIEVSVPVSAAKPSWLVWRTLAGERSVPGAVRVR